MAVHVLLLLFASGGLARPAAHSSSCQPDRLQRLVAGGSAQCHGELLAFVLCADACVSVPSTLRAGLVACVAVWSDVLGRQQ